MRVAKVIELVGESSNGWEDAVKDAVERASTTLDDITGVEVYNLTAGIKDGKLVDYKANIKLAFGLHDPK
ncbi:dodecin family protein [Candidatus Contubernalis alkaliaceticus]|uniref:dodecin family protein n=1 Tax=Candidatus Contubernalis alkaliaceticus TaxID=338645 RepID=UPI001F4BE0EC|nr:dodecin family protein [Candidatus Contubernalis alkalaceticus]UNC92517.1 dodecin domain-containing protein [Candidatus Contubernalis alkalaceticus]